MGESKSLLDRAGPAATKGEELATRPDLWVAEVSYRTADGQTHKGLFAMRAPSADDEAEMALSRARMCSGLPVDSFDAAALETFAAVAACRVVMEKAPDWFRKLPAATVFTDLYLGLYRGWATFATAFFRGRHGASGETPEGPALSIRVRVRADDGKEG